MTLVFGWLESHPSNFTRGRSAPISEIAIHYTAGAQTADGAAWANCRYFSGGARDASAHYFVDDGPTVWQSVSDGDTAWAVGDWAGNCRSISIEVCTAGRFTEAQVRTLTELVSYLMAKHGIPASKVRRHFDYSGKHCPVSYVDAGEWAALHDRITSPPAGTDVWLFAPNNTGAQVWGVEWIDREAHTCRLRNIASGKYLDAQGAGKAAGTKVWAYPGNGTDAQKWIIVPKAGGYFPESARPVQIVPFSAQGLCLDAVGGGKSSGTMLQLWAKNGTGAQDFSIVDRGDGTWTLINPQSGLAVDVAGGI